MLPVGIKRAKIRTEGSTVFFKELGDSTQNKFPEIKSYEFPIFDNRSPCKFTLAKDYPNLSSVQVLIEEIGGIPDPNYFEDTPTVIPEIIPDTPTGEEMSTDAV